MKAVKTMGALLIRSNWSFYVLSLIMLAEAGWGQQPPIGASEQDRCGAPEAYLEQRLPVWQKRLALEDWKISIRMARPSDLKPSTLGNIRWDASDRTAVIRVLHPEEYKLACPEMIKDMELTVVHELIHLELSSLPRSQASRLDEERAVNRIADALLALDSPKCLQR